MHCHGVPGDGRGPTGPWVSPHPRDYRSGIFKFISTDTRIAGRKPSRRDLHRTLEHGIEGTSMPSFGLLEEFEKQQLISYVIHLSLRGEAELSTMRTILSKQSLEGGSVSANVYSVLEDTQTGLLNNWAQSNEENSALPPTPYPYKEDAEERKASVRRGYVLFTSEKLAASCIKCHADYGRQVPFRYDEWGTLVRPANLTSGVYRGGRRPIDLYWRIRLGINGAAMPKAEFEGKDFLDKDGKKTIDPYWDLVNFVQALPYPAMLPDDVRVKIYVMPMKKESETAAK
jgi:mono/diheme cytochrome c family protein